MSNLPMQKAYYAARASEAPIRFGKASTGTTQISVEFEIHDDNYPNETITWIGNFTDNTAERTVESLQIAGWQGDDLSELSDQPGSQFLPLDVSLTVEPERDNDGIDRLRVRWINRPGGGRFKFKNELAGNDLKAFAAQMKATVRSVRAAGGAPRKPTGSSPSGQRSGGSGAAGGYRNNRSAAPNAPGDRDDIPPPSDDIPF